MVGWHHRLDGHEFEQIPGDGEGQASLACCTPWGHKELDMTQQLNNNNKNSPFLENKNKTKTKEMENKRENIDNNDVL